MVFQMSKIFSGEHAPEPPYSLLVQNEIST